MFSFLLSLSSAERVGSFIVLGDWGYDTKIHCDPSSGCGMSPQCQQNIADKMKTWVSQNSDVKFVLNLGDSFYPAGVSSLQDSRWDSSWKNVYGDQVTNLRWYSIYGNHDYEGRDYCACGDPANKPSLCAQRVTSGMRGWYMPDLYYHEEIADLGIEIVAVDANNVAESACQYLPSGCSKGACWANLNARYSASMNMVADRLKNTKMDNVLIMNHYHTNYFGGSRYGFINALKGGAANGAQVWHFGGHTHFVQENYGQNIGSAKQWLVGGGGGWGCDGAAQGFTVGIIDRTNGKTTISMHSELVDHSACCYHHVQANSLGIWEDENDAETYRSDEWWEGQLKMNGMWNQTCGGLECQERRGLLEKWRSAERLEGVEESAAKKLLEEEKARENGANFELPQSFYDTLAEIQQIKAERLKMEEQQME